MRRDYKKDPLWPILVDAVKAMALYPSHKSYVLENILLKQPDITPEELAARLSIPLGEAMVILDELRITVDEFEEKIKQPIAEEKRYQKVCLGGTFDIIHYGHLALLLTAVTSGKDVIVGVTSDDLVEKMQKGHPIKPFEERLKNLKKVVERFGWAENVAFVKIDDPYGPSATDASIEAIVVSPYTMYRVAEINAIRAKRLLRPLDAIICPIVLADDGKPISTTRIRRGGITPDGKVTRY